MFVGDIFFDNLVKYFKVVDKWNNWIVVVELCNIDLFI